MWADHSLLDTWVPGRSRCNCTLCSPHLHMLSSSVQCFVHLSRFGPCPCYPYPEPMAHLRWESRSKPTKQNCSENRCKNLATSKWYQHDILFIPYTRTMAVGFELSTTLASIQLRLSLQGSSDSSVHLSGQPSMEKSKFSFFLDNNSLTKAGGVKHT